MKFQTFALPVVVGLLLVGCSGDEVPPAAARAPAATAVELASMPEGVEGPAITGTATVEGLQKLTPGLSLVLRLLDTTDTTQLPVVVAESSQPAPQVLPLSFALPYDPGSIDNDHHYGLQVTLQAETLVLYGTGHPLRVLTGDAPTKGLSTELVRGGQPAADVPPSELAKEGFAELGANIGAMRRIHGERLEEEISVGWDAFVEDSGQIRMAREQVDFGDAGSAQFRYAYKGGKPWVVERVRGSEQTLVGWNEAGELLLNEKGDSTAAEDEVASLMHRAESLYALAAARR